MLWSRRLSWFKLLILMDRFKSLWNQGLEHFESYYKVERGHVHYPSQIVDLNLLDILFVETSYFIPQQSILVKSELCDWSSSLSFQRGFAYLNLEVSSAFLSFLKAHWRCSKWHMTPSVSRNQLNTRKDILLVKYREPLHTHHWCGPSVLAKYHLM